jgi:hypothetical protein
MKQVEKSSNEDNNEEDDDDDEEDEDGNTNDNNEEETKAVEELSNWLPSLTKMSPLSVFQYNLPRLGFNFVGGCLYVIIYVFSILFLVSNTRRNNKNDKNSLKNQ